MGCFFGCLRVKEKEKATSNDSVSASHQKTTTEHVAENQTKDGFFRGSAPKDLQSNKTTLSACTEVREQDLEEGNTATKFSEKGSLADATSEPLTPDKNISTSLKEDINDLKDEVKYLKSLGTILRTPSEIRKTPKNEAPQNSTKPEWHSWFPISNEEIRWVGPPQEAPTPPPNLHEELSQIPTPSLATLNLKQPAVRCPAKTRELGDDQEDAKIHEHRGEEQNEGSRKQSEAVEASESHIPASAPTAKKPSLRYHNIGEEDGDSFSGVSTVPSHDDDLTADVQNISFGHNDSAEMTPPPLRSRYSLHVTPLRLTDEMQTPEPAMYTDNTESKSPFKNERIHSEYLQTVLNPIENELQWMELKKMDRDGNHPKRKSCSEGTMQTENHSAAFPEVSAGCSHPYRFSQSLSFSATGSLSKDSSSVAGGYVVTDESSKKTAPSTFSSEDFSETPKFLTSQISSTEESSSRPLTVNSSLSSWMVTRPPKNQVGQAENMDNGLGVDSSLSFWLETPPVKEDKLEQSIAEDNTHVDITPSTSGLMSIESHSDTNSKIPQCHTPSIQNSEDKPILGDLSTSHLNSSSSEKSSSGKNRGDYDRPIIGLVAAHWNEQKENAACKWWDGKGIPNSTNKYKEDQKVNWHSTPFEERLEKALSNEQGVPSRKEINGKPLTFGEQEESDTAAS